MEQTTPIISLTKENYTQHLPITPVAFSVAEGGAMGCPGRVIIIDDKNNIYDFYALKRPVSLKDIVLLPGETDGVQWASYGKIHWMIRSGRICKIIGHQFYRLEKQLYLRNFHKIKR